MRRPFLIAMLLATVLAFSAAGVEAAVLNFNDAITGATSYSFDGNSDGIMDVVFTTTDPAGFNTVGPGTNMTYIQEPGLEGSSLVNNVPNGDLRADFNFGAVNSFSFGYALNSDSVSNTYFAKISIYGSSNNLLADATSVGDFTKPDGINNSSYPEGLISVNFSGLASYAIFDFESQDDGRYIIDNFQGTFGSGEPGTTPVPEPGTTPVPEPGTILLLGSGLVGLVGYGRRRK